MNARVLPHAGLAFGRYPERPATSEHPLSELGRALRSRWQRRGPARLPPDVTLAAQDAVAALAGADDAALATARQAAALALREHGLAGGAATGHALGVASVAMQRTLGLRPYPTQWLAAWLMLQGRLAEMATGEGKTVTAALAAAVAALSGAPVHVLTANDYLVRRDASAFAPFYAALGLSSGAVVRTSARAEREALYRRAVVYTTAKELGFDYLRDHHALGGTRDPMLLRALAMEGAVAAPVLPGLCFALVDEADSLLLDEACVPLILAVPGAAHDEAALRRAFEIAGSLVAGRDFTPHAALRQAPLTPAGRARVAEDVGDARGMLWPLRRAHELVQAALVARHLLQRGREYVVTADGLALVDELTGRVAEGRQWNGALQAMVEIKEGLAPSVPSVTAAQITYQRLFPRYLHLAGMSGTLSEARHELARLYGCGTDRVPLGRAARRRWLGRRLLPGQDAQWEAVTAAVRAQVAAGRPVLVGTASVAASQALSARLAAAGVEHQVLNALQDADESARIARAGQARCVTVTTNMAGRGTDIQLDEAARAAGGLHVIVAVVNRSRRVDRQLIGRSGRHGDPGSAEALLALDDLLLTRTWPGWLRRPAAALAGGGDVPRWLAAPLVDLAQRVAEVADARARLRLRRADRQAEESFAFAGIRE